MLTEKYLIWLLLMAIIMSFSVATAADDATRESASEEGCCVTPGDANGDGNKGIADASYIITGYFMGVVITPALKKLMPTETVRLIL